MRKRRILSLILAIFLIIPLPAFAETEPGKAVYSPWALTELTEGDKMGIYPMNYLKSGIDFTAPAEEEEVMEIYTLTTAKFLELELPKQRENEFRFQDGTRGEIINSLYALYTDYVPEADPAGDGIAFLQRKNILRGDGNSLNLEGRCSREEAIALYTRTVTSILTDLGKTSKGFFWSVENGGNKVYLFGSIHLGKHKMYPIRREVTDAFYSSDKVYFEVDPNREEDLSYMKKMMVYDDGRTLEDDLGSETYNSFREIMTINGIPESAYRKYRPWAAYSLISNNPQSSYLQSYLGVDNYFIQKAQVAGIPIGELESLRSQTDILHGYESDNYVAMIRSLLEEINQHGYRNLDDQLNTLQELWIEGDGAKLNAYLNLESASSVQAESYNEMLLGTRDINMADKIEKMLQSKEPNTIFIVVGAAHLTPGNSVTGILEHRGYTVKAYQ